MADDDCIILSDSDDDCLLLSDQIKQENCYWTGRHIKAEEDDGVVCEPSTSAGIGAAENMTQYGGGSNFGDASSNVENGNNDGQQTAKHADVSERSSVDGGSSLNEELAVPENNTNVQSHALKRKASATATSNEKKLKKPEISWNVVSTQTTSFPRFRKTEKRSEIHMSHNLGAVDLMEVDTIIDNLFKDFVLENTREAGEDDRITVSISHSELNPHIHMNFIKKNYEQQSFLNRVFKVVQSNDKFVFDGKLYITLRIIKNVSGGSRPRGTIAPRSPAQRSQHKRCVVTILNNNNSCGYLAIALGRFIADMTANDTKTYKTLLRQNNNKLMNLAIGLCHNADVDINEPMNTSETLEKIQLYLKDYQIIVISGEDHSQLFIGDAVGSEKQIVLEFVENHFNVIKSIKAFFGVQYFCVPCWKGFREQNRHQCPNGCEMCLSPGKCGTSKNTRCHHCNRDFYSQTCYERHRKIKVCEKIRVCSTCQFQYSGDTHVCDKYVCERCMEEYEKSPHYCMMKTLDFEKLKKEDEKLKIIVAYDIESACHSSNIYNSSHTTESVESSLESDEDCDVTDTISTSELVHKPILLIAKVACNRCENEIGCTVCNNESKTFYGLDCVKRFNDYLLQHLAVIAERNKSKVYVFAHNQKGYDGHFVLRDIFNRKVGTESVIMQGSKILLFTVGNVRFVDSLSFFHQPLDKLPKCFGFPDTAKGFFPHLFNTLKNQNYVGRLPERKYFSPEFMKPEMKRKFEMWFTENQHSHFNLKEQMTLYCENDVDILLKSIMKFRQMFKNVTGLDPITRCFTLAGVGLEYFRTKILPEKTMAITPTTPYGKTRMSSRKENVWLDWLERTEGTIERQQRIGPYYCDGKKENKVYEFWGCFWHGCESCYLDRSTVLSIGNDPRNVDELFRKVTEKREYYNRRGFTLVECWEHDFDVLESNSAFKHFYNRRNEFYNKHGDVQSLDIRDSFFGGRTNNLAFSHVCKEDEEIIYVDFTSLYPYVLSKYEYPVGHPEVIRENFKPLNEYFGFVKCNVSAPPTLNIPVLPVKKSEKLLFPLCDACAEEKNQDTCQHTFDKRALKGTWTSAELIEAENFNYIVDETLEVLHYPPEKRSSTLYMQYIKDWYKIKTQASGFPSWCTTQELKEQYVRKFYEKEGIVLDINAIEYNEALRFIAKLMLNSLWGKFAQRCNLRKTAIVKDFANYWKLLSDEKIEILSEYTVSNEATFLEYETRELEECSPGNTNIAVASFVTAYARLELYRLIQKIESVRPGRVLYFDTDSVIFVHKEGDPKITTGDYLGELTNEIEQKYGQNSKCTKFVSCGPKNYGIEVTLPDGSTKSELKVKGITLHSHSLDIIDINKMEEIALKYIEGDNITLDVPQWNIVANKRDHIVISRTFFKKYRALSDKRRINANQTLPYGYIDP